MLCEGPNEILFCRHCNTKGSEKEGIEGFSSETRANGRMHRLTESTVLKFHRHIREREKKLKRNPNLIERKLVKVLMPKKNRRGLT